MFEIGDIVFLSNGMRRFGIIVDNNEGFLVLWNNQEEIYRYYSLQLHTGEINDIKRSSR